MALNPHSQRKIENWLLSNSRFNVLIGEDLAFNAAKILRRTEIANDLDEEVVNASKQLMDHGEVLVNQFEFTR